MLKYVKGEMKQMAEFEQRVESDIFVEAFVSFPLIFFLAYCEIYQQRHKCQTKW